MKTTSKEDVRYHCAVNYGVEMTRLVLSEPPGRLALTEIMN